MTRQTRAGIAAAAAAAFVFAGCGGGGSSSGSGVSTTPLTAGSGSQSSGVSAIPTGVLYGAPDAASGSRAAGTLSGYDQFGARRDGFKQLVPDGNGTTSGTPTSTTGGTTTAPATTTPTTTTPTTTTPTTTTPTSTTPVASLLEADFDIGGEPIVARVNDAIPPGTQQFTVQAITAKAVTLRINGGLLPSGGDTVNLAPGQTITNQTAGTTYNVRLLGIKKAS
ncbi:MAG: hypothetical protein U0Y82_15620 [Thermoleophilia bacterium]